MPIVPTQLTPGLALSGVEAKRIVQIVAVIPVGERISPPTAAERAAA